MKIVCVSGGSYKSFYLNHFSKIKQCDLLVFNFGIIYDYIFKDELYDFGVVTQELNLLAKTLKAIVVAGVFVVKAGKKTKSLIVSDGKKIYLSTFELGVKVCLRKQLQKFNNATKKDNYVNFVVGGAKTNYAGSNKIVLNDKPINVKVEHCSNKKIYIFCSNHGVDVVKCKKLTRNFYKVSVLNFWYITYLLNFKIKKYKL